MSLLQLYKTLSLTVTFCTTVALQTFAQTADVPSPVTPEDYGKWETLRSGMLSPNGRWLAYEVTRVNEENELRVRQLDTDVLTVMPFGEGVSFSSDSRWLAYGIKMSESERKKREKQKKSVRNNLGLLNLVTGDSTVVEEVASFIFRDDGAYLAMERYPRKDQESKGVDLVITNLSTGIKTNFGNVSEYAWQEDGAMLAMIIDAEGQAGNGIQVFDPDTGILRTLDTETTRYTGLSWREKEDDLAVLREREDDAYEEATHVILAWQKLDDKNPTKLILNPDTLSGVPQNSRIIEGQKLEWSDDGDILFFGIRDREKMPKEEKVETDADSMAVDALEPAEVLVWHPKDLQVIPEQKMSAERIRRRNFLVAWHLKTDRVVRLGKELTEPVTLVPGQRFAIGTDRTPYDFDGMFGRSYQDLYLVDVTSGGWTKIRDRIRHNFGASPGGRYILYLEKDHYLVYEIKSGRHTKITTDLATSFVNQEYDHPVEQKPPFGLAGWTRDDKTVLVYDKYDIWQIRPDGTEAVNLTQGANERIRHRYVRLDEEEEFIDPSAPLYLSMYGEWSKKYGYARLQLGKQPERIVWTDDRVDRLTKAEEADIYAYVMQDFDDAPDYFVAPHDFTRARQVTHTNPFHKEYAWGRSELIEYENPWGRKLQGALFYPASYEPGKQYPLIVYIYEIRSPSVHRYQAPSERSYYNTTVFTSEGYFVLQPDIIFKARDPGRSSVQTIEAAVQNVLETGLVDPARVGLVGHSWGGYQAAYAVTQTDIFSAAVAGAPLTNLISMYGAIFWNAGFPESGHFEIGQERMEVPYWEDPDAYIRNSPVFNVKSLNTPLLVEVGDADGNVDMRQGIEYYNVARRAGKQLVLLAYEGENHGLAKKHNQIDYHRRILTWFGHYLKGEPAPQWITDGVPYLEQEKTRKKE